MQFPVSMMSLILRTIENVKNVQYKKFMQLWNQSNLISNDFACLQTVRYWEENIGHKAYQRISPHCDPINLRCRIQHSRLNRMILSENCHIFYSRILIPTSFHMQIRVMIRLPVTDAKDHIHKKLFNEIKSDSWISKITVGPYQTKTVTV